MSLPWYEKNLLIPVTLSSVFVIRGDNSARVGLVVLRGSPRYVKGIEPISQPKVCAK